MISIRNLQLVNKKADLAELPSGKLLITTINAFSYINARKDRLLEDALMGSGALLPDGISIVKACKYLRGSKSVPQERITGWDLFSYEMSELNRSRSKEHPGRVTFIGSSEHVLSLIRQQAQTSYPNLVLTTYPPPYREEFSAEENQAIVQAINASCPDLLWIGMTAPKQEKWAYQHWDELDIHCHCGAIGAVFDFFAGTAKRAPQRWQQYGLEWLYRLLKEPRRLWRRYIIGNTEFLILVLLETFKKKE